MAFQRQRQSVDSQGLHRGQHGCHNILPLRVVLTDQGGQIPFRNNATEQSFVVAASGTTCPHVDSTAGLGVAVLAVGNMYSILGKAQGPNRDTQRLLYVEVEELAAENMIVGAAPIAKAHHPGKNSRHPPGRSIQTAASTDIHRMEGGPNRIRPDCAVHRFLLDAPRAFDHSSAQR